VSHLLSEFGNVRVSRISRCPRISLGRRCRLLTTAGYSMHFRTRARVTFSYLAKMPRGHERREKSRVDVHEQRRQSAISPRAVYLSPAPPRFPDSTFDDLLRRKHRNHVIIAHRYPARRSTKCDERRSCQVSQAILKRLTDVPSSEII